MDAGEAASDMCVMLRKGECFQSVSSQKASSMTRRTIARSASDRTHPRRSFVS
jgi:hypothetical protein